MARGLFGRLWRSGGRRAQVGERPGRGADSREVGRRLEEARQRLQQTIPSPEETGPEERSEREDLPQP